MNPTEIELEDKKKEILAFYMQFLQIYTFYETFSKLTKKYLPQRLDTVLCKYLEGSS